MIIVSNTASGQKERSIHIKGRVEKNKILMRIAPATPDVWLKGIEYGYTIERYLVVKNNSFIGNKQKTKHILNVWSRDKWELLINKNDYALVAAQAIFGDSFEVTNIQKNSVLEIYNRAQELESRFGFSLFCADVSVDVAKASALYFADTLVSENEKWFYKVYLNGQEEKKDTSYLYLDTNDIFSLPEVQNVETIFRNRMVHFSWNIKELSEYYTAYWIEKSEDSVQFRKTTQFPIINLSNRDQKNDYLEWIDSLHENNKQYYFRVIGISPFGITGPPSKIIHGKGIKPLEFTPIISRIDPEVTSAVVHWKFPEESQPLLKNFQVERSGSADKNYIVISPLLEPTDRMFRDNEPLSTNYFRVKANSLKGQPVYSFPFLYQLLDSIPPKTPEDIKGQITNEGIILLTWAKNTEPDFLGYRVFRSNFSDSEFSLITKDPLPEPSFRDSISLKNLTPSIYYKLTALDNRLNPSPYSVIIKIKKPDILPPVPPTLISVSQESYKVKISWERSPSLDVTQNFIHKKDNTSNWRVIKNLPADSTQLVDFADQRALVSYFLTSRDSSGNTSSPSQTFTISVIPKKKVGVKNLATVVDRTQKAIILSWEKSDHNIVKYQIYRGVNQEGLSLYKTVNGLQASFKDEELRMNNKYRYRIKTIYEDGEESNISEEVEVFF